MQTFLPYANFAASAKVLDRARLGNQRVEAKQLVLALTVPTYGWKNHPAARMWAGRVPALCAYGYFICKEWRARGYQDSLQPWFYTQMNALLDLGVRGDGPDWLGDGAVHASHRSNLLRKMPEWYRKFGWVEADDLPYVWPEVKPVEATV